jgi:hypothetical protein
MTTLRWLPNKYPNEDSIWFKSEFWIAPESIGQHNSELMANLLNTTFGSDFRGKIAGDLQFVNYPLPAGELKPVCDLV